MRPLDRSNTYLTLEGTLTPTEVAEAPLLLALKLTGRESSGLTAAMSGLPQATGMNIHLHGTGPLTAWAGDVTVTVEGLGKLQGELGIQFNQLNDARAYPTLRLEGDIQARKGAWMQTKLARELIVPAENTPTHAAKQTAYSNPIITFALQAEMADAKQLVISHIEVRHPLLSLQGQGGLVLADQTVAFRADVEIPRIKPIAPWIGAPLQGHLAATLEAQGHWQRPTVKIAAQIEDLAVAEWRAKQLQANLDAQIADDLGKTISSIQLSAQGKLLGLQHRKKRFLPKKNSTWLPQENITWSSRLSLLTKQRHQGGAITPERLRIDKLELKDHGMKIMVNGDLDLNRWHGYGNYQLNLASLSHLQQVATLIGSPFSRQGVEGAANLAGKFSFAPTSRHSRGYDPWHLSVAGSLSQLKGLPKAAQTLLGSSIRTKAKLMLWPGIKMAVRALDIQGAALQMRGDLETNLLTEEIAGTIQSEFKQLALLSPLAGLPLDGQFHVDTLLSGTVSDPRLHVTGRSDRIMMDQQPLQEIVAVMVIDDPAGQPHGTFKLKFIKNTQEFEGLPVTSRFTYRLDPAQLNLSKFRLQLPGTSLKGQRIKVDLASGIIKGQLRGMMKDLNQLQHWLGQPPSQSPLSGTIELNAQFSEFGQQQRFSTDVQAHMIRSNAIFMESARIKVDLDNLFGEMHGQVDVRMAKGRWGGLLLRSAKLTAIGNHQSSKIALHLKGQADETFDLEANGQLEIDKQGMIHGTLAQLTGNMGQDSLQLEQAAHIKLAPSHLQQEGKAALDLKPLRIRYGPAHLRGHAYFDTKRLDMEMALRFPLGIAARLGGPNLQGVAQFKAVLGGTPHNPSGRMDLHMDHIRINDPSLENIPAANIVANALLENGQVNSHVVLQNLTSSPISALLLFPVKMQFAPFQFRLPAKGKVGGTLNANARLAQFALMAALDMQKLDGLVNIALGLSGTVEAPEVRGEFIVENGHYENGVFGTILQNVNLNATAKGRQITINQLQANDGERGKLSVTGQFSLDSDKQYPFQVKATLDKGVLMRREELQSTMSGTILMHGNRKKMAIKSTLTSNELLLYLLESTGPDIETVMVDTEIRNGLDISNRHNKTTENGRPDIDLDVTIKLPNKVFVRGRGLESEWQGKMTIQGTTKDPLILGQISVKKGYFEFLDQKFELGKGVVSFDGVMPPKPMIDLEATSEADEVMATLRLHGAVEEPKLELTSKPELPQDEIVARLLFSRDSQQLSPTQAITLLAAVEKLRSGGPGIMGKARESFGFDRLELEGDSIETGAVKAGKYINDKVFLGIERGFRPGSGKVSVELELTPNITLETEIGEQQDNSVGMHWKYDY